MATEYGATLYPGATGGLVDISVTRPGGTVRAFKLHLTIAGEHVFAREAPDHHLLPKFCPDRHINHDQSFCLGWGDGNPSRIIDEVAARQWWATVYQFLTHQASANARGVFPGAENGRAHGDAAKHQAIAERAAERLGAEFKAAASMGNFLVREDVRPNKHRLELWRANRLVARVSLRSKTLLAERLPCPCGSSPECEIDTCSDHAEALATFILEQHRCVVADKAYLDQCAAAGDICCGTLEECGLRKAIRRKQASSAKKESSQRARTSKYWLPPAKSKRPR
ncbi:E2 domain-containing protein [Xanthomonas sp. SS]|uniref:E2 domain-containing protein n=1 Tax=Xanthomonas sp. SS TaxID=2724122 RepID=UPI00163B2C71|nr:E2 domain-containing protein [Xanthomonas sp. SS]